MLFHGASSLTDREGSRRGHSFGVRVTRTGRSPVKNKVYKYWFKSRLKDRLAVAEKGRKPLQMLDFLPVDSPSNVNRCAPHLSALCPSSVKDRPSSVSSRASSVNTAGHLSPSLSTSSVGNSRKIRRFRRFARLARLHVAGRNRACPHLSTPRRVSRPLKSTSALICQ